MSRVRQDDAVIMKPLAVTIGTAAKMCGVGKTTMHLWVRSGVLKSVQVSGGEARVMIADLEEFLRSGKAAVKLSSLMPPRERPRLKQQP